MDLYPCMAGMIAARLRIIASDLAVAKEPADLAKALTSLHDVNHQIFMTGAEWTNALRKVA